VVIHFRLETFCLAGQCQPGTAKDSRTEEKTPCAILQHIAFQEMRCTTGAATIYRMRPKKGPHWYIFNGPVWGS
jgi:hypothetical protein